MKPPRFSAWEVIALMIGVAGYGAAAAIAMLARG
jgi:hypothetical protein